MNFTTLALGGEIRVPSIDGRRNESLKIPEGTATGSVFRIRGKGIKDVSGRGRGDLLVTVQAITPAKAHARTAQAPRTTGRGAAAATVRADTA